MNEKQRFIAGMFCLGFCGVPLGVWGAPQELVLPVKTKTHPTRTGQITAATLPRSKVAPNW